MVLWRVHVWAALGLCAIAAAGCASGGGNGRAGSCAAQNAAQDRAYADVVVDAVALAGPADPQGVLLSPARFRVLRYLKGHGPATITVPTGVTAAHGGGYAYGGEGIMPRRAERWRIYGRRASRGTLATDVCAGSRRLPPSVAGCPRQAAQPLPATALAGAVLAAVHQAPRVYRDRSVKGARATEAILAADDPARGAYAGRHCGRGVRDRTVVVYLRFPALAGSASLSEGVVLVSRFDGRYRVWARLH